MVSVTCPGDIGVIAPYTAQVRQLQELWVGSQRHNGGWDDYVQTRAVATNGTDTDDSLTVHTCALQAVARAARELEIHSVDGFQGCEKEVIVLCTVHANKGGKMVRGKNIDMSPSCRTFHR